MRGHRHSRTVSPALRVSESGDHLKAGHLGTADLTASTLADIGLGKTSTSRSG